MIALAGTVTMWGKYFQSKSDYDSAYDTYMNQKVIEDVNTHRAIAQEKNDKMLDDERSAIVFTSILGGVWIGNIIEAYINFPDYDRNFAKRKMNVNLGMVQSFPVSVPGIRISLDL